MQTCPGFFSKSLLESPGNLLEICSVKFVDTLLKANQPLNNSSDSSTHKSCQCKADEMLLPVKHAVLKVELSFHAMTCPDCCIVERVILCDTKRETVNSDANWALSLLPKHLFHAYNST